MMRKAAQRCVAFCIFCLLAASPAWSATPRRFPGLGIPDGARGIISVLAEGNVADRTAARAVIASATAAMPGIRVTVADALAVKTCDDARSSASLDAVVTRDSAASPARIEVQLRLSDCAGWPVASWDVQRAGRTDDDGHAVASAVAASFDRFRLWVAANPVRAANLVDTGIAYVPGRDGPVYFYEFVKTADGELRAIVRAGGPAYTAGLHSNDIIETIDGRFWWDYGTYQAQARAGDGAPHALHVRRDGREFDVIIAQAMTALDE